MEGLISVRAYKWRGFHLRWPINGGAYIWGGGGHKWRGLYPSGPINGGAYICEGL